METDCANRPVMRAPEAHPAALDVHQNSSVRSEANYPSTNSISVQRREDNIGGFTPSIVLFGETGGDKSSVTNLIAGQKVARIPNDSDALGCTFHHQRHVVTVNGTSCALWNTTGLEKGSEGTVPVAEVEANLRSLIQGLAATGGINLIIYCIRPSSSFMKDLQHNYDLFYTAACRKKAPVALVVTGLEHQEGEMETWWDENREDLLEHKMWFDAHECITTIDAEDSVIQTQRSDSQRRLRELVVRYSKLPAWKPEESFVSWVLPEFGDVFHRTISAGGAGKSVTIRRVVTCDMASDVDPSPIAPSKLPSDFRKFCRKHAQWIDGRQYEFVQLDKRALQMPSYLELQHLGPTGVGLGAGILFFYTSRLENNIMQPREIDMLEAFYKAAGGQTCPVIVVPRGWDDEERVIQACRTAIASRSNNIQVYPDTLSNGGLVKIIERLCIEHIEVKPTMLRRVYSATKQWFVATVDMIKSAASRSRR